MKLQLRVEGSPPPEVGLSQEGVANVAEVSQAAGAVEAKMIALSQKLEKIAASFESAAAVTQAIDQIEGRTAEPKIFRDMPQAVKDMHPGYQFWRATQGKLENSAPSSANEITSKKDFRSAEGSAVLELFRQDPDRFAEFMKDLKPHERQTVTMRLQDEMQSQNQIFSLISNLQQSEHQTSKSIIANIRA